MTGQAQKYPENTPLFAELPKPATVEELRAYVTTRKDTSKTANKIIGLRRLWHDMKSENYYLEGCLTALMKAAGESPDYDFMFFTTISGTLFAQVYGSGTDGLADALGHRALPHVFAQIGYDYFYIDRATITSQPALVLDAIKTTVDKGVPVMSFKIGNLPTRERVEEEHSCWCNIGGYDEDGVLYVNVYRDDALADENGYCAIRDGLKVSDGLYILGAKKNTPELRDIYREAVRAIPAFISLPPAKNISFGEPVFYAWGNREMVSFGQQAFYDWADTLSRDDVDFTDEKRSWSSHDGPWVNLLTNEFYMRTFFDRVINISGLREAEKARNIYMRIYAFCPGIQKLHGGDLFSNREVMAKPETRREIAAILRNMGDLHNELFELFKEGAKDDAPPAMSW